MTNFQTITIDGQELEVEFDYSAADPHVGAVEEYELLSVTADGEALSENEVELLEFFIVKRLRDLRKELLAERR